MAKSKRSKRTAPSKRQSSKRQYGAIPIRLSRKGKPKVLLLTSRRRGRWVIPKGWPIQKLSPAASAAREAYEEAGIEGPMLDTTPIGRYRYRKSDQRAIGKITVQVFLMRVKRQLDEWPERAERQTRWVRPERAAAMVEEPELASLLARVHKIADRLA